MLVAKVLIVAVKTITLDNNSQSNGVRRWRISTLLRVPTFPAPTPAPWPEVDALINRQTLFERSELGCLPQARVRLLLCDQGGRHGFWLLLPEQKWLGCRAEPHSC